MTLSGLDDQSLVSARSFVGGVPPGKRDISSGISEAHRDMGDGLTCRVIKGPSIAAQVSVEAHSRAFGASGYGFQSHPAERTTCGLAPGNQRLGQLVGGRARLLKE
jgi:hypothetical protein